MQVRVEAGAIASWGQLAGKLIYKTQSDRIAQGHNGEIRLGSCSAEDKDAESS